MSIKRSAFITALFYLIGIVSVIVTQLIVGWNCSHAPPMSFYVGALFVTLGFVLAMKNAMWITSNQNVNSNKGQLLVHATVFGILITTIIILLIVK